MHEAVGLMTGVINKGNVVLLLVITIVIITVALANTEADPSK